MTCQYCGTTLPDGALFCGECGRPVTSAPAHEVSAHEVSAETSVIVLPAQWPPATVPSAPPVAMEAVATESAPTEAAPEALVTEPDEPARPSAGFSIADLAFSSPGETAQPDDDAPELPDGSPLDGDRGGDRDGIHDEAAARCPQCGEPMARGDVFCRECGFVLRTVTPPSGINLITLGQFPADPDAPTSDHAPDDADSTTEVERLSSDDLGSGEYRPDELDAPQLYGADVADPDHDPDHDHEIDVADDDHDDDDHHDDHDDDGDADDAAEIDRLVVEAPPAARADPDADPDLDFDDPLPFSEQPVVPPVQGTPRSRPIPDPFPWGIEQPLREDLEATRLVADSASGTRYVLQFSTGESVTVAGSGLIGRNPTMQPGEYVDQLVPIFDAGKSVSKTHLEFGQEAGRFWVSDRYSTNGSVIRQPDAEPRRCDPGRRYFIARGTRVDVGEQFFVVS